MNHTQCQRCTKRMHVGGLVLARVATCAAIEDARAHTHEAIAALALSLANALAAQGACPNFDPIANYPDAYRADDNEGASSD